MLNDAELMRLRDAFFQACVPLTYAKSEAVRVAWADVLLDPSPETIRALIDVEHSGDDHWLLLGELVEIGIAHCSDVLIDIPSELDAVGDRRWQLRRELSGIVDGMTDQQLQRLVHWARSIAQ